MSNSSLPRFPSLKPDQTETAATVPSEEEGDARSIKAGTENEMHEARAKEKAVAERSGSGHLTPSSAHTVSPTSHTVGQLKAVNPSDKDQFQSKLGMANLIKNPVGFF